MLGRSFEASTVFDCKGLVNDVALNTGGCGQVYRLRTLPTM